MRQPRRRRKCSSASHRHGRALYLIVALAAAGAAAAASTSTSTPGFVPSLSNRLSMLPWSKSKRQEHQQQIASTSPQYQGGGGGGDGGDSRSRQWSGIIIPPLVVPPPIPLAPSSMPMPMPVAPAPVAAPPSMHDDILFYPPSMGLSSSPSAMARGGGGGGSFGGGRGGGGDLLERPQAPPPQQQQRRPSPVSRPPPPPPPQQQQQQRRQQIAAPVRPRASPPPPPPPSPPARAVRQIPPPPPPPPATRPPRPAAAAAAAAPIQPPPPPPTAPRITKAKATPPPPPPPPPRQQQQQQQQPQQRRQVQESPPPPPPPPTTTATIKPSLPPPPPKTQTQAPPPTTPTLTAEEQEATLRRAAAEDANKPRSSFRPSSSSPLQNEDDDPTHPHRNTHTSEETTSLHGVVKRITFSSPDTGFTVLKLETEEHAHTLTTVVGNFGRINIGAALSVTGSWKHDAKWGKQLHAQTHEETAPATQEGIENYLASGLVKGIGPVAARQIVGHFGTETLTVLNDTPERLVEVEGIGAKKVQMIIKAWQGQKEVTAVMLFLQSHNVTTTLATKIYKKYGNDSVEVLRVNPYQLADEMEGVGFRTVDKIAAQLPGYDSKSERRYRSGLLFILKEQANEGHCYGTRAGLLREGSKLLGAEMGELDGVVEAMIEKGDLVAHGPGTGPEREKQCLFLPFFEMCERQTAARIQELMAQPVDALRGSFVGKEGKVYAEKAARAIEKTQRASGVKFDAVQLQGLMTAAQGRFTVLTGGPGTGKTTMALAIIRLFQNEGAAVALCAPTGRAAQRLADGTGLEAKTIHRLLEYSSETKAFGRGPGNKLECDVLVVDEASMVDILLMYHLLVALPASASVVLVGDVDQLPPVGPGNVLRDIIDSQQVEVVRLTNIFRQAEQSAIVTNAHKINRGEMPDFGGGGKRRSSSSVNGSGAAAAATTAAKKVKKSESDFFLIEEEDPTKLVELITELCLRRLPKHYKLNPINDIQVLCPMKKGEVGTLHLNTILQRTLNPRSPTHCVRYGGREFRLGDKVMQVKNNYEKNVFNGGVGTIVEVYPAEKCVCVCFDGHDPNGPPVSYDATELDQIMLSYAATVHKAQGSEYRVVVAPLLHTHHKMMLQRNLLYTCVTRAKEVLVLVGSKEAIRRAVGNDRVSGRNSLLKRRLRTPKGGEMVGEEEG